MGRVPACGLCEAAGVSGLGGRDCHWSLVCAADALAATPIPTADTDCLPLDTARKHFKLTDFHF